MKCESEYCIYNKDAECIVGEIEINSLGMCECCIIVYIERDFLETEKERQIIEIERREIFEDE